MIVTPAPAYALGVDIGGTKTLAALVDDSGRTTGAFEVPTPAADGPAAILDTAIRLAGRALAALPAGARPIDAIGIGSAGVIDSETGTVLSATTSLTGWAGTDIRVAFQRAFPRLGVTVVNDVQAFTWAETVHGAAAGSTLVLGVMVGTGIGGGLVIDGRLHNGAHSAAGHLGHIVVAGAEGLPCPCGQSGHLESIASGSAMTQAYNLARVSADGSADGSADDLRAVADAAARGDALARGILEAGAEAVGCAIGSVANLIDPELIVIGGGVTGLGAGWLDRVRRAAARTTIPVIGTLRIESGLLGAAAVNIGAARLARPAPARSGPARPDSGPLVPAHAGPSLGSGTP